MSFSRQPIRAVRSPGDEPSSSERPVTRPPADTQRSTISGGTSPPPRPSPRPQAPVVDFSRQAPPPPVRAVPRPDSSSGARAVESPSPSTQPPASQGFAGRIDGASIADLVQMECLRGLRRGVRVSSDVGIGYLFFAQGQIVHARTDDKVAEPAAIEILGWPGGTFDPCQEFWDDAPTIGMSWQGLLMAAAQRADEAGRGTEESSVSRRSPVDEVEELDLEQGSLGIEMDMSTDEGEELEPGVTRAVRLGPDGNVLGSAGDLGDFPDVAAYSVRLCQLIGEAFGLEDFQGLECRGEEKAMVAYVEQGTVVALEALPQTDLATYKQRAGTSS